MVNVGLSGSWSPVFAAAYYVNVWCHGMCHEAAFMDAVGNPLIADCYKPSPYDGRVNHDG